MGLRSRSGCPAGETCWGDGNTSLSFDGPGLPGSWGSAGVAPLAQGGVMDVSVAPSFLSKMPTNWEVEAPGGGVEVQRTGEQSFRVAGVSAGVHEVRVIESGTGKLVDWVNVDVRRAEAIRFGSGPERWALVDAELQFEAWPVDAKGELLVDEALSWSWPAHTSARDGGVWYYASAVCPPEGISGARVTAAGVNGSVTVHAVTTPDSIDLYDTFNQALSEKGLPANAAAGLDFHLLASGHDVEGTPRLASSSNAATGWFWSMAVVQATDPTPGPAFVEFSAGGLTKRIDFMITPEITEAELEARGLFPRLF